MDREDRVQRKKQRQVGDRQVDREDRGQREKQRQVGDRQVDREDRGQREKQRPVGNGYTEKCFRQEEGGGQTRGETEIGGKQPVKETEKHCKQTRRTEWKTGNAEREGENVVQRSTP